MTYEQFLSAWNEALRRSQLPRMGFTSTTLDVQNLDRVSEVRVEPMGGQFAKPFYVTAGLSFRWSALLTARAATIEEDVLVELLGRPGADDQDTEPPWVRLDITLCATLLYGQPLPMPASDRWARWAREATTRLDVPLRGRRRPQPRTDRARSLAGHRGTPRMGRPGSRARRVARRPAGSDAGTRPQRTSCLVRSARPPGTRRPPLTYPPAYST